MKALKTVVILSCLGSFNSFGQCNLLRNHVNEMRKEAGLSATCEQKRIYLLNQASVLERKVNSSKDDCYSISSNEMLSVLDNTPKCPESNVQLSNQKGSKGSAHTDPDVFREIMYGKGENQGNSNRSDGFKNGGTLDLSKPSQNELEKRAKAQNMADEYSAASDNLKYGQQKALNEASDKIKNNKDQISDKHQSKDKTGLLNEANRNELSTDEMSLPDDEEITVSDNSTNTKHNSSYSTNNAESDLRMFDEVGRAVLNVEELPGALGGITRGINTYDNARNTLDRVQNGDPEFYFEQASSVMDLSRQTNSIIEARTRNGSANGQILDNVVTPSLKRSLDENDRMSDSEINQVSTRSENIASRGVLDHTPLAPIIRRMEEAGERVENAVNNYNSARQIFEDIRTVTRDGTDTNQDASKRIANAWTSGNNTVKAGITAAHFMMDNYYGAQKLAQSTGKLVDASTQYYSVKAKQGADAVQKWFFD